MIILQREILFWPASVKNTLWRECYQRRNIVEDETSETFVVQPFCKVFIFRRWRQILKRVSIKWQNSGFPYMGEVLTNGTSWRSGRSLITSTHTMSDGSSKFPDYSKLFFMKNVYSVISWHLLRRYATSFLFLRTCREKSYTFNSVRAISLIIFYPSKQSLHK